MLNVMGSAAQWERRIISQRTKDALAVKGNRGQGSWISRRAFARSPAPRSKLAGLLWLDLRAARPRVPAAPA